MRPVGLIFVSISRYNLENCYTVGDNCRMNFDAESAEADITDSFLPPFQAVVEQGEVSGLMYVGSHGPNVPIPMSRLTLPRMRYPSFCFIPSAGVLTTP